MQFSSSKQLPTGRPENQLPQLDKRDADLLVDADVKSDLIGHYRGEANLDQGLAMLCSLNKLSLKASADGTVWETVEKPGR